MESITKLKDMTQFILQTNERERDGSNGSEISIPIYDISSEEFLYFAENAIASETKEGDRKSTRLNSSHT